MSWVWVPSGRIMFTMPVVILDGQEGLHHVRGEDLELLHDGEHKNPGA